MLTALVTLALAQALPPEQPEVDSADATSAIRVLFQAGDLRRSISTCRACAGSKKKAWKQCTAMLKPLVEYQALIAKVDTLTAAEAHALLEYERQVSPEVPSRLSAQVVEHWVLGPWRQAQLARGTGDEAHATLFAQRVLEVDPHHAGARTLLGLDPPDAGTPRPRMPGSKDAGR